MTTTVFLAPAPILNTQFIPGGNVPASGGQLFSYISGSSSKLPTYTTSSGAVANSNPIVLDSGGNLTGSREVWLIQSSSYRFILAPSNDQDPPLSPYWTMDSITGVNDVANQFSSVSGEWILSSSTPVFGNTNSFVIPGDQRTTFSVGRRTKTINSGGTIYSTITSTAFTTSTAVGVANDSGNLDSGLSAVSYGFLSTPDGSMPWMNVTALGLNQSQASVTTGPLTASTFIAPTVSTVSVTTASISNVTSIVSPVSLNISTGNLNLSSTSSLQIIVSTAIPNISTAANTINVAMGPGSFQLASSVTVAAGSGNFSLGVVANSRSGSTTPRLGVQMSDVVTFGIYYGAGIPVFSALKGSFFMRTDGTGTNDRAFINIGPGLSTNWAGVVTIA